MFKLRYPTPTAWADTVVAAMAEFLPDHASAEYKASGMAMSMALHYRDKPELVSAMIDLAIEELAHFREVVKIMESRGLVLQKDDKDPYVNDLRGQMRKGSEIYFLDRLLVAAIIEARGAERFGLVATALPSGSLKDFYALIAKSEDKHHSLFTDLANRYFPATLVSQRLDQLLDHEAQLVATLPIRAALH
ncbi:MAG: tRNA-(ms[2]io[6]A)-hydroxylase [Porticoccaceae bacterium]|nr:tRNA-(ms[2]io[6]A)-hydroxylase [Porticoccaceae bacterium]